MNKWFFFVHLVNAIVLNVVPGVEIKRIEVVQVPLVKKLIAEVACSELELQQDPAAIQQELEEKGVFDDMKDVEATYFASGGTFLIACDGEEIVGSGALKRFSDQIGELTRFWIQPSYQSKGLGTQIFERLLCFAREYHYTAMVLEVYQPEKLHKAMRFYKKFGFYDIDHYKSRSFTRALRKDIM